FNLGQRLGGATHRWDAKSAGLLPDLHRAIKEVAIPFLDRIHSPRDVATVALSLKKSRDPYVQRAIAYALARSGETGAALIALEELVRVLEGKGRWQTEMANAARDLMVRLRARPEETRQRMVAWEAETARSLDLEKFR